MMSKKKKKTSKKIFIPWGWIALPLGALLLFLGFIIFSGRAQEKFPLPLVFRSSPTPYVPKVEKFDVPILMYHYIRIAPPGDRLGQSLSVTPANFNIQMRYLKNNGYISIKLADLADPNLKAISQAYFETKKPIVITFDDGYEDAFTQAFPVLKSYGLTGTFFIIRDFVGNNGYLTLSQIKTMGKEGMEIGSHTLDHLDLSTITDQRQLTQISGSKMGAEVFCYPFGKMGQNTEKYVREAGYVAAVTTREGIARQNSDIFALPRVRVKNGDLGIFLYQISHAYEHANY